MWNDSELTELDIKYAEAWNLVAPELGIEVISPFKISSHGKDYIYAICIKNFGDCEGINSVVGRADGVEFTPEQCGKIWDVAIENGYSPHNQAKGAINITPEEAMQHLNMYKWCGPIENKPKWHKGEYFDEVHGRI